MSDVSLLASTVEISESVNRWFRRSSSASEAGLWGGIFLAIVSLWVGLYLWDRFRKAPKKAGDDREGLFLQLCDLHKLSKAERLLLKNVAKSQKLSQPALAFVDPRILLNFAETSPGMAGEVRSLVDRLFGESLVEEIVSQSAENPAAAKA
jgi:hypothetical protein